jgi:hypothetical protein
MNFVVFFISTLASVVAFEWGKLSTDLGVPAIAEVSAPTDA